MKKIISVFIIALLLSGCSSAYFKKDNVGINDNKTNQVEKESLSNVDVSWHKRIMLEDQNIFIGCYGNHCGIEFYYYDVGDVLNGKYKGGKIILATANLGQNLDHASFEVYRFIKYNNNLIFLKKYSAKVQSEFGQGDFYKISNYIKRAIDPIKTDDNIVIKDLEYSQINNDTLFSLSDYTYSNTSFFDDLRKFDKDEPIFYMGSSRSSISHKGLSLYFDVSKRNGIIGSERFYIESEDGTNIYYDLKNPLVQINGNTFTGYALENKNIIWDENIKNINKDINILYSFDELHPCLEGSLYVNYVLSNVNIFDENNLIKAGKIKNQDYDVYVLKDQNSKVINYLNNYNGNGGNRKPTQTKQNIIIFFKDSLGRYIRLIDTNRIHSEGC